MMMLGWKTTYTLKSWMVQCGNTAVPFRKLDAKGRPVEPPKKEGEHEAKSL